MLGVDSTVQKRTYENKSDERSGIRLGVWIFIFCLVVLCTVVISPRIAEYRVEQATTAQKISRSSPPGHQLTGLHGSVPSDLGSRVQTGDLPFGIQELDLKSIEQAIEDRRTWVYGGRLF